MASSFDIQRHINYFATCLRQLPTPYSKLDTNRLTLVHFCVHALDLMSFWDNEELPNTFGLSKSGIIHWIYTLQTTQSNSSSVSNHSIDMDNTAAVVVSPENGGTSTSAIRTASFAGFKGGTFLGNLSPGAAYNEGHIAMTYTALCTLRTLGDDLSQVDHMGIIGSLQSLQLPNGSYQSTSSGSEHDMRFLYCACCISHLLDDWAGINQDRAVHYIQSCRSWDGALSLIPGGEGHGGSTFCGIASLVLMGQLDHVVHEEWRHQLVHWCVHRQVGGMQGRPNKAEDTCYSYWIGGTLRLLGYDSLLDHTQLRSFVMNCQTRMGGFSKVIGDYPDILHAFYSLSYLSLSQPYIPDDGGNDDDDPNHDDICLKNLNCTLGICQERVPYFLDPPCR